VKRTVGENQCEPLPHISRRSLQRRLGCRVVRGITCRQRRQVSLDTHTDSLLVAYLRRLLETAHLRERIGQNAQRYALAEHKLERSATPT